MKKNKKTGKKAEMSSRTLIAWILLILAFGIVLLFFYMFDWTGEVDKQACHSSVIFKATVPELKDQKVVELPLQCETEKICITSNIISKGNCDKDYLGEKYQTVRVSGDSKQMNDEVNKIIADKLYECWWMMGQGKVKIYSRYSKDFGEGKVCNICTRIAFDDNIKSVLNNKVTGNVNYFTSHNAPGEDVTYYQYITNNPVNYVNGYEESQDFMNLSQKAIIFGEISSSVIPGWIGVSSGTAVGIIIGAQIGAIVPLPGTTLVGAGVGAIAGYWGSDNLKEVIEGWTGADAVFGAIQIKDYNIETLKSLNCSSFEGKV
ncbi:MAG: hypothetical protein WC438_02125 [Candidatus Pacearchaeota archaeon]